jgi:hypothetical protein
MKRRLDCRQPRGIKQPAHRPWVARDHGEGPGLRHPGRKAGIPISRKPAQIVNLGKGEPPLTQPLKDITSD